jgi:Dirigent-like protein
VKRLALTLAIGGVLAVIVGPAAPGKTGAHQLVIRLISDNSVVDIVDKAPKGKISAGDRFTTTSTLRNQVAQFGKPKGALVGHDRATMAFLSATSYTIDGNASLPGGTLHFHGRVRPYTSAVLVTGGTGRYANARGTVTATDTGGARSINVYRLTLP